MLMSQQLPGSSFIHMILDMTYVEIQITNITGLIVRRGEGIP